ncbi:transferase family protein [Xylariaceae sp. FL0804]|nr:transferase family protein [Xylariaceae sp. FL0804]
MMESMALRSIRVFPASREAGHHQPTITPLSILDASVARFSPTGAIWLYDALPNGNARPYDAEFAQRLQDALCRTLDHFPQWAGQLRWADVNPRGTHTERFHRPVVSYGYGSDPGVEFGVVRHSATLASFVPEPTERTSGSGIWVGDAFPQNALVSQTRLALHDLREYETLPAVLVQLNFFECGGYAVGVKIAHPLADAQSLMVFMGIWAANSRMLSGHDTATSMPSPPFRPSDLDTRATGDIDGNAADPEVSAAARALPVHRYDWWDRDDTTTKNSKPSPEVLAGATVSPSTHAPWETWDFSHPVTFAIIHFPGAELDRMKAAARAEKNARADISRLDVLLARLFRAINQARGTGDLLSEDVFLNVSLDVRRRVSPPLAENFIGSPLFLTHVGATGSEACTSSLGHLASRLRETMGRFGAEAMGALLHDMAYEISPQRLWQAFLGSRHLLATSWLRLPLYDVDFDNSGRQPRYVHSVMPKCDGIVQTMDAAVQDGGVDVALYLDAEVMNNLLQSNSLNNA